MPTELYESAIDYLQSFADYPWNFGGLIDREGILYLLSNYGADPERCNLYLNCQQMFLSRGFSFGRRFEIDFKRGE